MRLCVFTGDLAFEVILGVMPKYSNGCDGQAEDRLRGLKFANAE